ncbi:AfsR/SARP family transcriptional regulator [Streptomyces sp. JNUCC 64]
MRFGVLGPLTVWDDRGEAVRVPEVKVRALLADLLAHDGGPLSTDRLIHDLWGDRPPARPSGALQARVSQLRRAIGRDRVPRQPPGYRLRLEEGESDAARFRTLVTEARRVPDPRARAALFTEALGLWRGPAFADFADAEFVREAVHRLTEQRLSAVEEQAGARLAAGDHVLLAGDLAAPVAEHPLREGLRALYMRALYAAGRQGEALAAYEDLRARLAGDLGVDPGPGISALHRSVLRQDPALAAPGTLGTPRTPGAAKAVKAAGAAEPSNLPEDHENPTRTPHLPHPPHGPHTPRATHPPHPIHLPTPLTPLIGRDRALDELAGHLGAARLVTLTGPGGVGKTRLAVAAASADARTADLPDGVWLVELAGVRTACADDLAQVVTTTLGIRDDAPAALPGAGTGGPSPSHRLASVLRDRRTMLVLDNCEHVVEAAAGLAGHLLGAAPGLRVLATSQEPLGLTGEVVFQVEPLGTDDAVRLFLDRVAARAPGLGGLAPAPSDGPDRATVAEICRRLDGIPLALELAATRVRALGVTELAARLGDRFRLLTSGQRGAPARQQTLRAVIDWSWELLSAPERIVLRRLAVFGDGCDLAAATGVCAGDGVAPDEVLDLVTRLVDRSLVTVAHHPTGPRYRLLESVTAYATERLHEMADLTAVRDRHLRHYLDLAERTGPGLRGAGQRAGLARLDAESGNLRAALDEALRRARAGEPDEAVRLATALAWYWLLRGRLNEARRTLGAVREAVPAPAADSPPVTELSLLRAAFALLTGARETVDGAGAARVAAGVPDPVRRARALWLCAYGLFQAGTVADAEELNATALELFTTADDRWGTAAALGLRATLGLVRGDLTGVGRDGLRGAALFRGLGDLWGELQTVSPLAALAEIKGDYADAERRQHEGLRMARELGLEAEESARLSGLGRLALLARDWDRARDLHERARRLAADQGYKYGEIHSEMGLALGARRRGRLDEAEAHLLRIRDGFADLSSPAGDHLLLAELGFIAELRGDPATAADHHLRGLEVARALAEPRALALSLEGLAGAAATDDPERAAVLLGAADTARRDAGAPLPPAERADVDRVTTTARTALPPATYESAFTRGTRMTTPRATAYARETNPHPPKPTTAGDGA